MVVIKKTTRVGEDVEKGKPHALLVGVQTGASTMVNSVEVLQNIYKGTTTQSSNFTSGYLKKTKVKKKYALPCCWVALQSLSHIQLFVTSWTAAHQASLSITISQSLLKPCPLSRRCHPTISSFVVPFYLQSFPASGSFSVNQFTSGGQRIRASASASVLPMNIQG